MKPLLGMHVIVLYLCIATVTSSESNVEIIALASEGGNRTTQFSNKYVFTSDSASEDMAKRICDHVGLTFINKIATIDATYYVCMDNSGTGRRKRATTTRNVAKETSLKNQPLVKDARQEEYVQLSTDTPTRSKRAVSISDAQWTNMWHLQPSQSPSMHVYEAWDMGYTGQGITVAVVDSGIDVDHSDLVDNYRSDLSYDHLSGDSDPSHSASDTGHGTMCAGVVAAVKNGECSLGIAYEAEIAAQRMLDEVESGTYSTSASAMSHRLSSFDIYSNSWGYVTEGKTYSALDETIEAAIKTGISQGRGGKGAIYTFSAGNYNLDGEDVNAQGIKSSIYTITIGSVSPDGSPAYYTTPGACVLASTYGGDLYDNSIGIITSDRDDGCKTDFQGTSAACPVASGIIALALQANEQLFWFGLMDAKEMVSQALTWPGVGDSSQCNTGYIYTDGPYTYSDISNSYSVSDCTINKIEHLKLRVRMDAADYGNIAIYLTSPSGTRSELMRHRPNCDVSGDYSWDYMSVQFWGETAEGTWTIQLVDSSSTGKDLVYWRLSMYGIGSGAPVFGASVFLVMFGISIWKLFSI